MVGRICDEYVRRNAFVMFACCYLSRHGLFWALVVVVCFLVGGAARKYIVCCVMSIEISFG